MYPTAFFMPFCFKVTRFREQEGCFQSGRRCPAVVSGLSFVGEYAGFGSKKAVFGSKIAYFRKQSSLFEVEVLGHFPVFVAAYHYLFRVETGGNCVGIGEQDALWRSGRLGADSTNAA